MNVLVTGGTGLVGSALVPELARRGHAVRVLSRRAHRAAARLHEKGVDVSPFDADVTVEGSLRGAADGCEAVVHLVGTIDEGPSGDAYEKVNVDGTRRVVAEAERAGARRLVHVSSLGADRRSSAYQRSKAVSEEIVAGFSGAWTVIRPGGVYGPRDQVITLLLRMLRGSPFVPLVGDGRQRFQPIWHADLGRAITSALERPELARRILEVAGDEVTSPRELVEKLADLIDKPARFVRIPAAFTSAGSRLAAAAGFTPPLNEAKRTMLLEESVVDPPSANALRDPLGVEPTPLDQGLRAILHELPLQPPIEGVGPVHRKRYRASAEAAHRDAERTMELFRDRCVDLMPIDFAAEPGAARRLDAGATLSLHMPLRGHMLMRVVEIEPRRVTLATVEGHPIAGAVRFETEGEGDRVDFVVDVHARASNWLDRFAIGFFGGFAQDLNWKQVARRGARLSRGRVVRPVERRAWTLRGEEALRDERTIEALGHRVERPETMR